MKFLKATQIRKVGSTNNDICSEIMGKAITEAFHREEGGGGPTQLSLYNRGLLILHIESVTTLECLLG